MRPRADQSFSMTRRVAGHFDRHVPAKLMEKGTEEEIRLTSQALSFLFVALQKVSRLAYGTR